MARAPVSRGTAQPAVQAARPAATPPRRRQGGRGRATSAGVRAQASTCERRCWRAAARATRTQWWRPRLAPGTCARWPAAGRPTRPGCSPSCARRRARTALPSPPQAPGAPLGGTGTQPRVRAATDAVQRAWGLCALLLGSWAPDAVGLPANWRPPPGTRSVSQSTPGLSASLEMQP